MTVQGAVSGSPVDSILAHQATRLNGARLRDAQAFAAEFLRRVADDELAARSVAEWSALCQSMLEFVRERRAGAAKIRIVNAAAEDGFGTTRTLVDVVTDDMPFLVDSVGMAIASAGLRTHTIIHPIFRVVRDPGGHLLSFGADADAPGTAESVMHFEVDRVADAAELERLKQTVAAALDDVRASVADWKPMHDRMLALADELPRRPAPIDAAGLAEAAEFLRWVADENFTFLGYREYRVVRSGEDEVLQAV
ncbi:MAG TPA: NAD-glutamate dehydrogenase, partial [Dokdonella sp.]